MPVEMIVTPGSLPEGTCYNSEQARLNGTASHLSVTLPATASIVNTGPNTPPVDSQSFPWLRINSDGTPDRTYYYWNGAWVSLHPIVPGLMMAYPYDITNIDTFDGGEPGAITPSTGPMWRVVTDAQGRFIIGAGQSAGTSNFPVASIGGEESVALVWANIPPFSVTVLGAGSTPGAAGAPSGLGATVVPSGASGSIHDNTPSYFAAYWIQRTERQMYRL